MDEKKNISAFWSEKEIYFLESVSSKITKIFKVAAPAEEKIEEDSPTPLAPANMLLISRIQKTLRQEGIPLPSILNLTFPSKDIIFRAFVIPAMNTNEIKSVVEFEVSRYIPFTLSELAYSFYPMTITTAEGKKKIRIIFLAMKKESLANYTNILEQASLQINLVEPAHLSLIRFLKFKETIDNHASVLIVKAQTYGKIVVADQGIPQFVREFSLGVSSALDEKIDFKNTLIRFVNEIRISLEYFTRQNTRLKIAKALLLTLSHGKEVAQKLEEQINLPVEAFKVQAIIQSEDPEDINYLYAYGASLAQKVPLPAEFDLSKEKPKKVRLMAQTAQSAVSYKSVFIMSVVCLSLIILAFIIFQQLLLKGKTEEARLVQTLGEVENVSQNKLEKDKNLLAAKLKNQKTIRLDSRASLFLAIIPQLLPEGTWIKSLDIQYSNEDTLPMPAVPQPETLPSAATPQNLFLDLSGFNYLENTQEQFRQVNQLLKNMQRDKYFARYFKKIELVTVDAQKLEDHTVTFFNIKCQ